MIKNKFDLDLFLITFLISFILIALLINFYSSVRLAPEPCDGIGPPTQSCESIRYLTGSGESGEYSYYPCELCVLVDTCGNWVPDSGYMNCGPVINP